MAVHRKSNVDFFRDDRALRGVELAQCPPAAVAVGQKAGSAGDAVAVANHLLKRFAVVLRHRFRPRLVVRDVRGKADLVDVDSRVWADDGARRKIDAFAAEVAANAAFFAPQARRHGSQVRLPRGRTAHGRQTNLRTRVVR